MTTESVNYYDTFVKHYQDVSKKLKNTPTPSIDAAISYWSEYFEWSEPKNIYGDPGFQEFICRFFKELILACDHCVNVLPIPIQLTGMGRFVGIKQRLQKLNISDIETIFNESQNHNYLAFLGFICIAISYHPELVISNCSPQNSHISSGSVDFQSISKDYFREINSYSCEDTDFDSVYADLITRLDCFDDFLKALVIQTSIAIKPPVSEDNVKSLETNKVLQKLIRQNNLHLKKKIEESFMNGEDIKKFASIVALIVGAVLTVGGTKYLLDQKNKNQKSKNNLTKARTRTSQTVPISRGVAYAYILVLMLDFTDSVKDAVNNLRTNQENKLSKDTVSAISKLTVLQAIWHGRKDTYENSNLKEIFDSGEFDDEHNLIFIEIEMTYHEYDFDKGAGLSNARDGLMKLVSNPNSYRISKIVPRTASDSKLKSQISALYR